MALAMTQQNNVKGLVLVQCEVCGHIVYRCDSRTCPFLLAECDTKKETEMTPQSDEHVDTDLEAGQYIRDGKLYGWTGRKCQDCQGYGEDAEAMACTACAGTGEEHGEIVVTEERNVITK
jgi:hypothetical protein